MHLDRPGIPVGGTSALSEALVRCLQHHGAELRGDALVEKVLTEGGRAVGVRLKGGESDPCEDSGDRPDPSAPAGRHGRWARPAAGGECVAYASA